MKTLKLMSGLKFYGGRVELQTLILCIHNAFIDKLTKDLVEEATSRDFKENIVKPPTNAIRTCGISFSVWEKTNADGKASGMYDFTSLMGSDKKILKSFLQNCIKSSPQTQVTLLLNFGRYNKG